jgi:hypothetical protein
MPGLLATVGAVKPREKSGSLTMARYAFQVHVSMLKMIEMHQEGMDYRAAFDHFDDLMVLDKAQDPEMVEFYQIKSRDGRPWSLKEMSFTSGKGDPPKSFIGRLHHHMAAFGDAVSRLGFVSNLTFRLKLKSGAESTTDHTRFGADDLHPTTLDAIKSTVAHDCEAPPTHDGTGLLVFEATSMGLRDQDVFVRGRLGDYLGSRGGAEGIPVLSLYETLSRHIYKRSVVTQEFTSLDAFYENKTLCRDEIEAMFLKAISGRRFHESWPATQQHLIATGMPFLSTLSLYNECIRYISARSTGESGALCFNTSASAAILSNRAAVDGCTSLSEIAALLEQWVSSDYENRRGAAYVEAFEAGR